MLIDRIIDESVKSPNFSEQKGAFCRTLCFRQQDCASRADFFSLLPGISLVRVCAETALWPLPEPAREQPGHRILQLYYCLSGRNKICLNSHDAVSIGSGELVITGCFPEKNFIFPSGKYEGISILIDLDEMSPRQDYLKRDFRIDLPALAEQYISDTAFYTVPSIHEYKETMKTLWELSAVDSGYALLQMKLCVLSMLLIVSHLPSIPVAQGWYYLTASQIRIAEQVHAILSSDLSRRHSARELAEQFGISESSLKNYFKNVYGKSFSVYQRDARMQKSAQLLKTTSLPVAEIAASVGYVTQSKFADVFRKHFGVSPLEYRRLCSMKSGL